MSLKIKQKTFTTFLEKVRMEGTQILNEAILKFEKEGLKIDANTQTEQARVMGWLKTGAFVEYEEIGNVPLNDLTNVLKVFKSFGDEITLKKEGNLLTVSGKSKTSSKKVGIELPHENFLASDTGEPNLEFEETFKVPSQVMKDIFSDIKVNKDVVLTITTEEKKVKFTNTGKYKFTHNIEAPQCKGGSTVSMGAPFMDVISNLTEELEISVKSEYPAKIREVTELSVVSIIVAPRTGEE